jgi:hypothetical protein
LPESWCSACNEAYNGTGWQQLSEHVRNLIFVFLNVSTLFDTTPAASRKICGLVLVGT